MRGCLLPARRWVAICRQWKRCIATTLPSVWAAVKPSDVEAQRGFRVTRPLPTILTLAREATIAPDLLKQALAEGRRRGLIRLSEMTQARADASPPAWFAALLKKHCA
jgi:hypothetical protein